MNIAWLLVIPLAAYFVGGYLFAHRMRAVRFADREDIPFNNIYKTNFQNSGVPEDMAQTLWLEAAKHLRVAPGKLRPSDRFDKELSYCLNVFPFVDLNDEFYAVLVSRLREKKLPANSAKKWETLGDYIVGLGVN